MKKLVTPTLLSGIISMLMLMVPGTATFFLLKPEGPLFAVVLFAIIANLLYYLRLRLQGKWKRLVSASLFLVLITAAAIILIDIVIIPYSAYISWFSLVREQDARGAISYLFLMTVVFFSAVFSGSVYLHGILIPLTAQMLTLSILATVILQDVRFFFLSLAILALLLLLVSGKNYRGRNRKRAFSSAMFLLTASFFCSMVFSGSSEAGGSKLVDTTLSPAFRELIVSSFPEFPIIYGIPGYGYSFDRQTLGKTPVLSNRAIFEVEADPGDVVYLRTAVYDVYQGDTWKITPEFIESAQDSEDLRFERPAVRDRRKQIRVKVLGDFYSMLPHTLGSFAVNVQRKGDMELRYGNKRVGYLLEQPLMNEDELVLYEGDIPFTPESEEVLWSAYLAVPEWISPTIRSLAARLRQDTTEGTVRTIRDFLSENYIYTLQTEHPEGEDLVEYFLFETQRGYCVHFASAFTILARLNGIPTRYATGFLVRIPYDEVSTRISGYSAHAWPEIYRSDMGWTSVEATPPLRFSDLNTPEYYRYMTESTSLTTRQLRELIGEDQIPLDDDGLSERDPSLSVPSSGIFLLLSAAAVLGFLLMPGLYKRRKQFFVHDPAVKISILSAKIAAKTSHLGVHHPESTGWTQWAESLKAYADQTYETDGRGLEIDSVLQLLLRTFYGNYTPHSEDIQMVRQFLRRIDRRGRRKN